MQGCDIELRDQTIGLAYMLAEGWLLQGLVAVDALQHAESMLAAPPEMLQEVPWVFDSKIFGGSDR
jgi:hypothetical protein